MAQPAMKHSSMVDKQSEPCKKTYDGWASTTDKRFLPNQDEESRLRAIRVAVASLGAPPKGFIPLTAYAGSRAAAGIPADPSRLDVDDHKQRAEDFAGLLRIVLGSGSRNKGVVLGDSNHLCEGIPEALVDSRVLATLKASGITHVCLELTPAALQGFRDPAKNLDALSGIPLVNYFQYRQAPLARFIQQCDAAGIAVVPMDIMGPATQRYFEIGKKLRRDPDRQNRERALAELSLLEQDLLAERIRITAQVWVPRVIEAMQESPRGKFVILAGDLHVMNPLDLSKPDIVHADLDERLSKAFRTPVPYVRVMQQAIDHPSVSQRAAPYPHPGMDIPEFTLAVPSRQRQEVERIDAFRNRSDSIKRRAGKELEAYDQHLHHFVESHAYVLEALGRSPAPQDLKAIDALLEARRLTICGKKQEALEAMKPAKAVMDALVISAADHPREAYIRSEIAKLRHEWALLRWEKPEASNLSNPDKVDKPVAPVPPLTPQMFNKTRQSPDTNYKCNLSREK